MDRRRIIDEVAKETGLSKTDSAKVLNTVLNAISNSLARKERVILQDFGTFYTLARQPRKARNPKTGEVIPIPRRTVARWRASREIKSKVK